MLKIQILLFHCLELISNLFSCNFCFFRFNMSRPTSVSPRPGSAQSSQTASKAKGFKDIRIDEEVKIAVNIALERFRYSDQKGGWSNCICY